MIILKAKNNIIFLTIAFLLVFNNIEAKEYKSVYGGHISYPTLSQISHDGKYFISSSEGNYISIYDTHNGELVSIIDRWKDNGPADISSRQFALSYDNKLLLTITIKTYGYDVENYELWVWDISSAKILKRIELPSHYNSFSISNIFFAPNGNEFYICLFDGEISKWSIEQDNSIKIYQVDKFKMCMISHDGLSIAFVGYNDEISLLNLENDNIITIASTAPLYNPYGISFSFDDQYLLITQTTSINFKNDIFVFDLESRVLKYHFNDCYFNLLRAAFNKNNNIIYYNVDEKLVTVDINTGKEIQSSQLSTFYLPTHLFFSNSENAILSYEGLFGMTSLLSQDLTEVERSIIFLRSRVKNIMFTPDDSYIVLSRDDFEDILIQVFDYKSNKVISQFSPSTESYFFEITPDSKSLILPGKNNSIEIRNLINGDIEEILEGHKETVLYISISDDERFIVSTSKDSTIIIWDYITQEIIDEFQSDAICIYAEFIDNNNKLLTLQNSSEDYLEHKLVEIDLELKTSKLLSENTFIVDNYSYSKTALSLKSNIFALVDTRGSVWTYDLLDKSFLKLMEENYVGEGRARSVAISNDGNTLSIGLDNNRIVIWDLLTNDSTVVLSTAPSRDEIDYINHESISFSNDKTYIVTGTTNPSIIIWNYSDIMSSSINLDLEKLAQDHEILLSPNPANEQTEFQILLDEDSFVELKIYDLMGNEIFNHVGYAEAGYYTQKISLNNFVSGAYYFVSQLNDKMATTFLIIHK